MGFWIGSRIRKSRIGKTKKRKKEGIRRLIKGIPARLLMRKGKKRRKERKVRKEKKKRRKIKRTSRRKMLKKKKNRKIKKLMIKIKI